MNGKTIAHQLNIPTRRFEQESAQAWISSRVLAIEADLLRLAHRYGVRNTTEFLRLARQGKISDTAETIDDFFNLDHLEKELRRLRRLHSPQWAVV